MSEYKKIRCPFCNKLITESSLEYDFCGMREQATNRILCTRCKRTVYYTVRTSVLEEVSVKT